MEKFKVKIDFIKEQLTESNHDDAVFYLLNTLKNSGGNSTRDLLESGVLDIVLAIIKPSNQKIILETLKVVTEKNIFIKEEIVDKIITNLMRNDLDRSMEESTTILNILYTLLSKTFQSSKFQGISLIEKHAHNLLNFLSTSTFESNSFLTMTNLFNLIISYSEKNFKELRFSTIQNIYFQAVDHLLKVKDNYLLERIRIACCISVSMVNICYETKVTDQELEKAIFNRVQEIAIEDVIPILKNTQIDIESAEDFIRFLKSAINLKTCKNKKLCYKLVNNGYLTFLLKLSVFEPDRKIFRKKVCKLISKIIISLENCFKLSLNDWKGGTDSFEKYLSTGLENLPASSKWDELLKISNQESNSLLVLIYCHFLATEEKYIFTKNSLAVNLINLDKSSINVVFFKILWLLYSVSLVTSEFSDSSFDPHLYSKATNALVTILQDQEDIERFYTHHEVLLFSMQNVSIPDEIRLQIIRLWIDKSKSDAEFKILIKQCLDQGYNDLKIIKILMKFVHEEFYSMENPSNTLKAYSALLETGRTMPREAVEFILKTLLNDLINIGPENSNVLNIVLLIVCNLPSLLALSVDILRHCAEALRNTILKQDIDLSMKTQLIGTCVFLIKHSLNESDSKIGQIFLENKKFVDEIYNCAFNSEDVMLTQVSIYTLSCLMQCHERFSLQYKSLMMVKFKQLENLFEKVLKQTVRAPVFLVQFVKLLLLNNRLKIPLITLQGKSEYSDLKYIFYIYYELHLISNEIGAAEEIYECLKAILYYCYFEKLNISFLLTCRATHSIFKTAMDKMSHSKQPNYVFLDFAMTWLQQVINAKNHKFFKLNHFAKRSVSRLKELKSVLITMKNKDTYLIEDFCAVVDNYSEFHEKYPNVF